MVTRFAKSPALPVTAILLAVIFAMVSPGFVFGMSTTSQCSEGYAKKMTKVGDTHWLCRDGHSQPLLNNAELRALYDNLAPGVSTEITEMFLRSADPLPYVDIFGPGATRSSDQPNPPRAVYLMRPISKNMIGPLLLVAPAQISHSLSPSSSGGLADDVWRVAEGPYAPTIYGTALDGSGFVAFPQELESTPFPENARAELVAMLGEKLMN